MRLLLGTNNQGKMVEMTEVLSGLPIELLTPKRLNLHGDLEETGKTFKENAVLKARHFFRASKLATLADDSGIIVDALSGELGVETRRWGAGPLASDEEWISFFLERMARERNKKARFVCSLCFVTEDGLEHLFEGSCDGCITERLEADYLPGLPISACFQPNGFGCVYSAMGIEQKNNVSHRGKAMEKVKKFLETKLNQQSAICSVSDCNVRKWHTSDQSSL